MKKHIAFTLSIMMLLFLAASKNESSFEGEWIWKKNSENMMFFLRIKKKNEIYCGYYCAVALEGKKIDCYESDETPSFKFEDKGKKAITIKFKTHHSDSKTILKIKLKNNNLLWRIIKKPQGEYFFPLKAEMIKE